MTHSQQQQSYSGLRSPERSSSTYFYFLLAKRPFARWRQTHYKYQNPLDSRVNAVMWSVDYSYKDAKMHKSGRVQPLLSSNINSEWTGFQTRLFFRRGQKGNTQRKPNSIIVFLFIQNNPSFKNKLKHAYLHRSIDVKFIFNCLFIGKFRRLFSSANILQNRRSKGDWNIANQKQND